MVWIRIAISKLVMNTVLVLLAAIVLVLLGCGSDSTLDEGFVQIRTAPDNYTVDDLKTFGFKTSKNYDVEGLPDALDAWKGFWGLDPYDRHDYEIRFYASHDLAVSSGKPMAIESTGPEFEASRETQTWTEGVKDRWQAQGVTDISGGASKQSKPRPTYPNWAILGEYGDPVRWP
ncbi:MAG: hypothetical protein Ct9H300mP19_03790 [Dehalococcoidia bacterium]|nr:MAG: hypothetical protein Ct9H300mP19_03790 [Dehalococcoidia bacterium]